MPLRGLLPGLRPGQNRRAIVVVASFVALIVFFRVKIPLLSGRFLYLSGLIGGLVLGAYIGDRDESLAAAASASILALLLLFVAFLLDDVRLASEFGVAPTFLRADPGSVSLRLLLFGVVELLVVVALSFVVVITAVLGALIGSTLRPVLDDVRP